VARFLHVLICGGLFAAAGRLWQSRAMDESAAIAALLGEPIVTAADLAAQGATVSEIAAQLGITPLQAAADAGPVTPAQIRRIEQVAVARAVGSGDSLPHVQAIQFMLANHLPAQYGRQAQAGSTTLRVIVDRGFKLRDAQVTDGEVVTDPAMIGQDNDPPA
jgi:hypothetical protein